MSCVSLQYTVFVFLSLYESGESFSYGFINLFIDSKCAANWNKYAGQLDIVEETVGIPYMYRNNCSEKLL